MQKSCELYDTDFDRGGFVGVAIAGYGEEEIYPHLVHLHIGGVIDTKLKYNIIENVEISESTTASIAPLAQTDVMQTFLFGINDQFINDLAQEIPKQINGCLDSIDDTCFAQDKKEDVRTQLTNVTGRIIQHMTETAGNNYMRPIIQSVSSLPIEELALLAESMINITSLRRKVAIDRNIGTVGGPIDVSIISKGDGFIWLKRKHYLRENIIHNTFILILTRKKRWILMKNDAVKISIESGEGTLVSNQDGIEFVHSEFIRDQMVKLNSDSEVELNITENDQYSNSNTLSLSFIRKR